MSLRFLHTSDWQIGKVYRFVDDGTMGLLQEARDLPRLIGPV